MLSGFQNGKFYHLPRAPAIPSDFIEEHKTSHADAKDMFEHFCPFLYEEANESFVEQNRSKGSLCVGGV